MRLTDAITFGKYKKLASDNNPVELVKFLNSSGLKNKLSAIGEDVVSLVEHMDDLKKTFELMKMVPEKAITVDPTNLTVRKVDLNDRVLQLFYESFISGQHTHLLNQIPVEIDDGKAARRKRGKDTLKGKTSKKKGKGGKSSDNETFVRNEIEERKQELREISEDITENMKYLVESKYSLQLKQLRKKKSILLEPDKQDLIKKFLKLGKLINFHYLI